MRALAFGLKTGLLGPVLPADPPNSLKIKDHRNPGFEKTMATSGELDLARVKQLKLKFENATVTDILLSVMTITLRRYFEEFGEVPQSIRGNFPIDLRGNADNVLQDSLGNRWASADFRFDLKYNSIEEMVYGNKRQAELIKNSPGPLIDIWLLDKLVPLLSRSSKTRGQLYSMMLDMFGKVTGMLSSNMGPQVQMSFAGRAVQGLRFYALAPIGLYFGIISYNGKVSVGVVLDSSVGEASDLAKHWAPAFEELCAAVGKYDGAVPRTTGSGTSSVHWPSLLVGAAAGVFVLGWWVLALFLCIGAFFAWA